mgnify:CR=1 FL=1
MTGCGTCTVIHLSVNDKHGDMSGFHQLVGVIRPDEPTFYPMIVETVVHTMDQEVSQAPGTWGFYMWRRQRIGEARLALTAGLYPAGFTPGQARKLVDHVAFSLWLEYHTLMEQEVREAERRSDTTLE